MNKKFIIRRRFNERRSDTDAFISLMLKDNKENIISNTKVNIANEKEKEYNKINSMETCLLDPLNREEN